MANLYQLNELPPSGPTTLSGDVAHHLLRVMRVRVGQTICLGDGRGNTAPATISAAQRDTVSVQLGPIEHHPPLSPAVTLAFAVPRAGRADWLFEHATEVGITTFQPLLTERCRPQGSRVDRWRKIAAAAAGQCGRAWLPAIREPIELPALLESDLPNLRYLADGEGEALNPADRGTEAVLLVGPEGGLTADEKALTQAASFLPSRFGAHILRTETAAVVGASILLSHAR